MRSSPALVLPRRPESGLSLLVSAGLPTVAMRAPSHGIARALLAAAGVQALHTLPSDSDASTRSWKANGKREKSDCLRAPAGTTAADAT